MFKLNETSIFIGIYAGCTKDNDKQVTLKIYRKQGLFQLFWEKAPGLNWEKYAPFCEFFRSVKL